MDAAECGTSKNNAGECNIHTPSPPCIHTVQVALVPPHPPTPTQHIYINIYTYVCISPNSFLFSCTTLIYIARTSNRRAHRRQPGADSDEQTLLYLQALQLV